MGAITVRGRQLWPRRPRPRARHVAEAPDPRPLWRRWEDGPRPGYRTPPAPPGGSMLPDYEQAGRAAYAAAYPSPGLQPLWTSPRCDDTGERSSTRTMATVGYGVIPHFCPRCEAPDDQPHYQGCPFYDPDEAALFTIELGGLGERVTVRARNLDPAAWRPYLTPEEFAETFPGVPYDQAADDGPHTGELAAVRPELADQLAALDAETRDWLHQRAAAHADVRARLIIAWQSLQRRTS